MESIYVIAVEDVLSFVKMVRGKSYFTLYCKWIIPASFGFRDRICEIEFGRSHVMLLRSYEFRENRCSESLADVSK